MKYAHYIKLSVFSKEDENADKIKETLLKLVPFDPEKEKIQLNEQKALGFNEKTITIFEIELKKDKHIRDFLKNLLDKLGKEQKLLLLRQAESRLDNEFNFFIRLEKERLMNGMYWITDGGNCFHIKINIATFPKTRERCLSVVDEIFRKVLIRNQ